jgi:type IV secretion system protein VirB6
MATTFYFYQDTFGQLNSTLSTYVSDVASNIIGAITPVTTTLIAIYVMLWGWAVIRGVVSEPIIDGFGRIVRLTIIIAIALNVGRYNGYLSDMLWNSPDKLASYVASGYSNSTSNTQFLDSLMSQIYDFGDAYWKKAHLNSTMGIPDIGLMIIAVMVWSAGLFSTAYGAFLLALAKMALAILLGVGPLFILFAIFDATKRFFDAWMGQALHYVFLVMLTSASIKMIMTIIKTYLAAASTVTALADPGISQALPTIVLCLIGTLVMMQMPSMSSALGGGLAISSMGAVGWVYAMTKSTVSTLRPINIRRSINRTTSDIRTVASVPMAIYRKITPSKKTKDSKN